MASRVREFSLVSYLSESQIMNVLLTHSVEIRNYAYAYHDKDTYEEGDERAGELKEPHYHLILVTFNAHTLSAVSRWFSGYTDDYGIQINSFCVRVYDRYACFDYLIHKNDLDKYQYSPDIIKCSDIKFFNGKDIDLDLGNLIIEGMKRGQSYEVLRKRFGTHFILNYQKYKAFLEEEICFKRFDPADSVMYQFFRDRRIEEFNNSVDEDLIF